MAQTTEYLLEVPKGVSASIDSDSIQVTGKLGALSLKLVALVKVIIEENGIRLLAHSASKQAKALLGTFRALILNMCKGVTEGFQKKLNLVGTGYRVQVQGDKVNLSLGFSHPVIYQLPEGIKAESSVQSELIIKGIDKRLVGTVAAEIRSYRPLEPYKGKGFSYSDEVVVLKEVKKK